MYLTIRDEEEHRDLLSSHPASVYQAFEQVKDGRNARGKRYPLAVLLTVLLLGKLAGETTISGVVDWVAEREGELKRRLCCKKDETMISSASLREKQRSILHEPGAPVQMASLPG